MNVSNAPSAILFPHSGAADDDLKGMLAIYRRLVVCLPWSMDAPPCKDTDVAERVEFIRPSEGLKPRDDFHATLAEFQNWMRTHPDHAYHAFFKAYEEQADQEMPRWAISQQIRTMKVAAGTLPPGTFKWHLVLHMSAMLEAAGRETDALWAQARRQEPILAEALEQPPAQDPFFACTPQRPTYAYLNPGQSAAAVEAWLELFGTLLPQEGILLTFNPHVAELAAGQCERQGLRLHQRSETPPGDPPVQLTVYELDSGAGNLPAEQPALIRLLAARSLTLLEFT